jgi:hypothetical protein
MHCLDNLFAWGVITDAADEKGIKAKTLQMPGDVEWRAAKYRRLVGKTVEKHFSENDWSA